MTNPIAKNVLDFWFGARPLTPEDNKGRSKNWFVADADFDYDIERRFGKLVSTARSGAFDSWRSNPDECLALILILDQFPRNLYRGQASAFSSDDKALELARELADSGGLKQLGYTEQAFALMPFQHAEDLTAQQQGYDLYLALAEVAPEEWRSMMLGYADFSLQHKEIIERFGRFPHRNSALGRESNPEETAYLSEGGKRFGQ